MLSEQRAVTPLPAADIWRARKFYEDVLGFEPVDPQPDGEADYHCAGGTWFFIHPSEQAGTNESTALAFMVADLDTVMTELRERGIIFEEYDLPDFTTVEGVATRPNGTRMAWFKDTEDNLIGLGQPPS